MCGALRQSHDFKRFHHFDAKLQTMGGNKFIRYQDIKVGADTVSLLLHKAQEVHAFLQQFKPDAERTKAEVEYIEHVRTLNSLLRLSSGVNLNLQTSPQIQVDRGVSRIWLRPKITR